MGSDRPGVTGRPPVEEGPGRGLGQGYKYLATGLRFAAGITLFVLVGFWLDRRLHTSPLFLIAGTLIGAGLSFVSVWRELSRDQGSGIRGQGRK